MVLLRLLFFFSPPFPSYARELDSLGDVSFQKARWREGVENPSREKAADLTTQFEKKKDFAVISLVLRPVSQKKKTLPGDKNLLSAERTRAHIIIREKHRERI
jgi:hypothetical protein